jgi:hypothetical protein
MYPQEKMKDVYTIRPGRDGDQKGRWVRIGIGFVNGDQSINVKLDATPINGELHIRDYRPRPWQQDKDSRAGFAAPSTATATEEVF